MIINIKILWTIFQPVNLIIYFFLLGCLFYLLNKKKLGIRISFIGLTLLFFCGFYPIGTILSLPLENRFINSNLSKKPYGIIVLGGSEEVFKSISRNQISLNDSSERLIYFYLLSKRFPDSKLVFTGGGKKYKNFNESEIAKKLFEGFGMNVENILFETLSVNTYENAKFSYNLIQPKKTQDWVIVTSALTMPRAIGTFKKVGWNVVPYSVDFKTSEYNNFFKINRNFLSGLKSLNNVTYEWLGLFYYKLINRTDDFLPCP